LVKTALVSNAGGKFSKVNSAIEIVLISVSHRLETQVQIK